MRAHIFFYLMFLVTERIFCLEPKTKKLKLKSSLYKQNHIRINIRSQLLIHLN